MSTRQPSRVVFVGNIPYGLTEEQIVEIFSSCGQVMKFRLVYDRDTGRPKGFGFCEYPDYDSAASAVRNLNDHEIMGRKLRVDFSNETVSDDDGRDQPQQQHGGGNPSSSGTANYPPPSNGTGNNNNIPPAPVGGAGASSSSSTALPQLPQGKDLPPGTTCTDAISRTLNTLPPPQLLDILQQMKTLAINDPARATELLHQAPQLSYAIFQALLIMGLVSPDAISSVLDASVAPAPPMPQAPLVAAAGYGGYPGGATGTPPVAGAFPPPGATAAAAVPVPVAAAPAAAAAAAPPQDQQALIAAVLELPQEMIDQLPENERQQVLAIRATYGRR